MGLVFVRESVLPSSCQSDVNDEFSVDQTDSTPQEESLDNGDDCCLAILACIQVLCSSAQSERCGDNARKEEDSFANRMATTMDGGLLAKLVQSCLVALEDPARVHAMEALRNKVGSIPYRIGATNMHFRDNIKGNVPLKIQSLKTLRSLMILKDMRVLDNEHPSAIVKIWRTLLPGCFTVRFIFALVGHFAVRCCCCNLVVNVSFFIWPASIIISVRDYTKKLWSI